METEDEYVNIASEDAMAHDDVNSSGSAAAGVDHGDDDLSEERDGRIIDPENAAAATLADSKRCCNNGDRC